MKQSRDHKSRLFFVLFLLLMMATSHADLPKADHILVEKAKRTLSLMRQGKELKTYRIALGPNAIGPKEKEGDGKTPEGVYRIDWRNPQSLYHLSLHISYPSEKDAARAKKAGVSPGGDIMIHGQPNDAPDAPEEISDWTIGCIAVTNPEIEEIWKAVPDGTSIEIKP